VRQRSGPAHGHTDAPSAAVKRAPQRPCPCPTLPVWAPHHPPEGGPRAGAGRRWYPTPDHPAPETPSACRPPSSTPPDSAGACRCYRWGFHRHPRRSAPGNANAAVPIGDLPCDHMPPRWWGSRSHVLIDCLRRGCGLRNALAPVLVVCLKFTSLLLRTIVWCVTVLLLGLVRDQGVAGRGGDRFGAHMSAKSVRLRLSAVGVIAASAVRGHRTGRAPTTPTTA